MQIARKKYFLQILLIITAAELLTMTALEREESMREKAETSERRFRDLVGHLDAVVYEADAATGKFLFVSECAGAILGYPAERGARPGKDGYFFTER